MLKMLLYVIMFKKEKKDVKEFFIEELLFV